MASKKMGTPYHENGKPGDDTAYAGPSEKLYFGRSASSWGKISLFYCVYYSCLAVFIAICFSVFLKTIDSKVPSLINMDSLLKGVPGVSFKPQPNKKVSIIKFISDDYNGTQSYVDNLNDTLYNYIEQQQDENTTFVDCSIPEEKEEALNGTSNTVCKFDLADLGDECTVDKRFGYLIGKPCILLKLNKIYGWLPKLYEEGDKIPEEVTDLKYSEGVQVTCEGVKDVDKENMGKVTVYPEEGFRPQHFPYMNQKNYQAPLVFVQFENLTPGVQVRVWCKVWAKNIYQHKNDKIGGAIFHIEKVM